ncbi:MAG: SDR family NAD(P)-dependent oxidoreductase, partial [Leptotrichia sp.]|nr:SDR family NAD(P)-dependent oxidoreductase [Leptotrichia sp.]
MKKVILLTGASSGIGYQTTENLAKEGHVVYGAARRIEKMETLKQFGVKPIYLDATDDESIKSAIDTIIGNEGRIDVLINNAGYGSYGAIEDVEINEAR